jgi:hypothetical protein
MIIIIITTTTNVINCPSVQPVACCYAYYGQAARPRTQHDCHHDTKVKPEAATAVIELLMMGGKTPETC